MSGISVSFPTVKKILILHDMAHNYDGLMRMDDRHLKKVLVLSEEQTRLLEMINPMNVGRHM